MMVVSESVLVCDQRLHSLDPLVGKLNDLAAFETDEMLMVARSATRLVPSESFAEVVLDDEAGFDQQVERAIDGGLAHMQVAGSQQPLEILYRQVFRGGKQRRGDHLALVRERQVVISHVAPEPLDQFRGVESRRRAGHVPA